MRATTGGTGFTAVHVPRRKVTKLGPYGSYSKWEPEHWVDPRTGAWVPAPAMAPAARRVTAPRAATPAVRPAARPPVVKPKPKPKPRTTPGTPGSVGSGVTTPPPADDGGFHGLSDDEITRRANALADAQLSGQSAAIERARAAAMAQAQRDAATYSALGSAQMQMIGQIPANIQAIRNTAGEAIASFGNQIAGAGASQLNAEQAANAAFAASQGAPTGPGPAPDGAPVATGPGPAEGTSGATPGLDANAAMAASAQIGGVLPARQEAEIGAASSIAASGMPAVVARATQDQVAMRMSQAATEDADYRQQLIDLAATRGGIYSDALSNLYDIESKKFGQWEAEQRLKLDQNQFNESKRQWQQEMALKKQAELAAEVQAGIKSRAQAQKDYRAWVIAQAKLGISQQNADTAAANAGLSAANYYVDSQGRTVPKGYKYNAQGQLVSTSGSGAGGKPSKTAASKAMEMARSARGTTPRTVHTFTKNDPLLQNPRYKKYGVGDQVAIVNPPKQSYVSAYKQIYREMRNRGYNDVQARRMASTAVNSAYGPGVGGRPAKGGKGGAGKVATWISQGAGTR